MTWLFPAEPSKKEQLNVHTCFHFLPYLLQPDTFTRSVLMWKKENLFAFMGKAYYFRYSAFAMVNTYLHNESKDFLMLHLCFYSRTNKIKLYIKSQKMFCEITAAIQFEFKCNFKHILTPLWLARPKRGSYQLFALCFSAND